MPRSDEPRPLTRSEVALLFRGIADHPPAVRPELAAEALTVTATAMASWCHVVFEFPKDYQPVPQYAY